MSEQEGRRRVACRKEGSRVERKGYVEREVVKKTGCNASVTASIQYLIVSDQQGVQFCGKVCRVFGQDALCNVCLVQKNR